MTTTKEQQDAWDTVCDEGHFYGLLFVHCPNECLLPAIRLRDDRTVYLIRHGDPNEAIEVARQVLAKRRNETTAIQAQTIE